LASREIAEVMVTLAGIFSSGTCDCGTFHLTIRHSGPDAAWSAQAVSHLSGR